MVESVDDVWELEVKNPEYLAYVTQTTLSVDETAEIINALHKRFTKIISPKKEDICYAAQNRQNAVKRLVDDCDLILVVGSHHSHNSARLKDVAEKHGVPAYLVDNASEVQRQWVPSTATVGWRLSRRSSSSSLSSGFKNGVARWYQKVPGSEKRSFSVFRASFTTNLARAVTR